ncbi:hypothetical protein [Leptospira idonii]|uniref:Lipoprotein n=1 Tax=Leptospira idonii TaxID=1193500 RepID=A0A4R9M215_9LEPT|nr:hypothetical protein [Leptospira idonii]TGN19329.1 hypothetical protein EHS15_09525 [Leptospira idonii]
MYIKHFVSFVFLVCFLVRCNSFEAKAGTREMDPILAAPLVCPFSVEIGTIYGKQGKPEDAKLILSLIEILLSDICAGNLNHLPEWVHPETGLFVDAKGHWTKDEVLKDLADPKGYFATNFWRGDLLDEKKKTTGNLTIQKAFQSAKLIYVDYFFDSSLESEVQFRFLENPKNARYLINPIFQKIDGKWMLLRMF